ncbi:MAG: translation initiation factor IF-2 [Bacteroides sp.]
MTIRLNKVTRDLNVGITTAVEFLQKKGHAIEANPNTKITEEEYAVLVKEFSTDKNLRLESERFIQERQNKDRNKTVAIDGYNKQPEKPKAEEVFKTTPSEDVRQKFKPIGKIDLDNLNRKMETEPVSAPKAKEVKPQPAVVAPVMPAKPLVTEEVAKPVVPQVKEIITPAPVTPQPEPVKEPQPIVEEKKPVEAEVKPVVVETKSVVKEKIVNVVKKEALKNVEVAQEKRIEKEAEQKPVVPPVVAPVVPAEVEKEDAIFKIHQPDFVSKINVIGQIDLAALNQSTRPKKKSKEEKRKEREEKDKARLDQKKQMKEAIIKEIRKDDVKLAKSAPKEGSAADAAKKKRNRINKEKVDVNNVASNFTPPRPNSERAAGGARPANAGASRGPGQGTGAGQNRPRTAAPGAPGGLSRFKKPVMKADVNDVDVAKQVKETLARLTTKGKNKTSKYRKEKRDTAFNRQQKQDDRDMAESSILKLTEFVTANELASMMDVSVNQVIGTCMSIGMMVSINQRLDAETINLVAEEFGFKTEYVSAEVAQAIVEEEDHADDLKPRAPIVTVMGHVDHGKTSLLDYIRKANVIAGEAGGITQHIGAYHVSLEDGRDITFLDTPGHEAFTAMRARGAKVTDVAIIIVAADDDVMPQTKEAINHAVAAGVPIVFAINKVDKPHANPEKIKETLAQMNFLVEEWGGKYQSQDISAKKGTGVKELMEKVLLEAEMLDLKANPDRRATGSVIESTLDKGRGYVATILVSNGTLKLGDIVLAGTNFGRVKAMFNERNQRIQEAGPSEPVLILGLNGAPQAGDMFHVIETEQEAREIANKREQLQREQGLRTQKLLTLDEVGRRIALGNFQELNVIVKGDVDGSIEALSDALIKLSTEQIQVNVIHKAVGQISESDVTLAAASDAIIIGFQVRPSAAARKFAEQEGVDIRMYSVIYAAIEEVKAAMEGMLAPEVKEVVTATIEVREVFNITKVGTVAGAMVKEGKAKRSDKARLIRDGIVIFSGTINALKRFKDDVKEVATNYECGISLTNYHDIKVGDMIETYEEIEVKQTL